MYIMCVKLCVFSALSCGVGTLQILIIIILHCFLFDNLSGEERNTLQSSTKVKIS